MTPERSRRVQELFHSALGRPPDERATFLNDACAGDESLRLEVESMFSANEKDGSFLDSPEYAKIADPLRGDRSQSMVGRMVGHYRILAFLGAGGMGEAFLAEDPRLRRKVALKLLPSHFVGDQARLHRFRQEARAASALNHPNILTVHEIGEADGTHFIATEFIDGETLRASIKRTRMKLSEALDVATQVASALSAAHQAGVVHRDIKPENVMLRRDRLVKVLDFGLAKLTERAGVQVIDPEGSTNVVLNTRSGVVMGTVRYMSPEQAQGTAVDARTDVWSLGCVIYEMVTGHFPFEGTTSSHVIVSILEHEPPPLSHYSIEVPAELQRIVRKALQKDREERYQTAKDMALDLKTLRRELDVKAELDYSVQPVVSRAAAAQDGEQAAVETLQESRALTNAVGEARLKWSARYLVTRITRHWLGMLAALAMAALMVAAAVIAWRLDRSDYWWSNPLANAQFTPLTDFPGTEADAAISRDGKFVSFLSDHDGPFDVWVGQIGTGGFNNLTKQHVADMRNPDVRGLGFSPDGSVISFWVRHANRTTVWAVPTMGGTARPYLDGPELDWSPDGTRMVYHTNDDGDPLFVTAPNEKAGKQIYAADRGVHCHFPIWSPDGAFIYFVQGFPPDEMDIWRIRPTGGPAERITFHSSRVTYPTLLNEQMLLYIARADDGTGPWLYGMDLDRRVPHRISLGVERYTSIAASADGRRLVATVANPDASLWRVPISDRVVEESAAQRIALPTVRGLSPRIGPGYLVYLSSKGGNDGIWKFADGTAVELWSASLGRVLEGAAISPGGHRIAFTAQKGGRNRLYAMNSNGTGLTELATSLNVRGAPAWPPVGEWITVAADQGKGVGLFKIPLDGGAPIQLVAEQVANPVWSPDGRFLVYSGVEVGTTFPLKAITADGEPHSIPKLILSRGANRFLFLAGGPMLVFLKGEFWHKNFWLVDLVTGEQRQLTNFSREFHISDFDVSPDGREIIFSRMKENSNVILIDLPEFR
jgi:serine/threonine protein kinase/Tol biopolymer transport system component